MVMVKSKGGWGLLVLAGVMFLIQQSISRTGAIGGGRSGLALFLTDSILGVFFEFWWVFLLIAVALLIRNYGVLQNIGGQKLSAVSGQQLSIDRDDIVKQTNWSRINRIQLLQSIGISFLGAGTVAFVLTIIITFIGNNNTGYGSSLLSLLIAVGGAGMYQFSRTKGKEIKYDYTHRISVGIPDLFEPHTFHVNLRQIVENLGYVIREEVTPGQGGVQAEFAEDIYLSEGGFIAQKRPIGSPISTFPDESILSDLVNLTSGSVAAVLVGIAFQLIGLQFSSLIGDIFILFGIFGLIYAYIVRTRKWARFYCLIEGTVSNPTVNLYSEDIKDIETHSLEPTITSSNTSSELVVTVGIRASPYFDDEELKGEFNNFISDFETVAAENCHQIIDQDDFSEQKNDF